MMQELNHSQIVFHLLHHNLVLRAWYNQIWADTLFGLFSNYHCFYFALKYRTDINEFVKEVKIEQFTSNGPSPNNLSLVTFPSCCIKPFINILGVCSNWSCYNIASGNESLMLFQSWWHMLHDCLSIFINTW